MVTIRAEQEGDRAAIDQIHRAAFPSDGEARLVAALRASGSATVSRVAEEDGRVVGHVLFSPVSAASQGGAVSASQGGGLGLAPVAVRPDRQGGGIGALLVSAGLQACRDAGFAWVVVVGEPAYYERFGFRHARTLGLLNEYDADAEFMAMELRPGGLTGVAGLVRYGPEFGVFGTT